ncbi:Hypothetical protein R9X50_00358000 [Acrodontium crateriforme]|uniref:Uncharacterized protein n=1 Tax=Acrodontium crateriforme TaxID=150365 RepID=A0AAQ3RA00_9PEZI|nr:Hypothetical protein R9X50_00358000 [Acrodontium crateriforme]
MAPFLQFSFDDIYDSIDEVEFCCKDDVRTPIHHVITNTTTAHIHLRHKIISNNPFHHSLYKIKLKDDIEYAFDLSGAQFGSYRTVIPWEEYEAKHVKFIVHMAEFGRGRVRNLQVRHNARQKFDAIKARNLPYILIGNDKDDPRGFIVRSAAERQLHDSTVDWMEGKNLTFDELLDLPLQTRTDETEKLLKFLRRKMAKAVKAAVLKRVTMVEKGEIDVDSAIFSGILGRYPLRCEQEPHHLMRMTPGEQRLDEARVLGFLAE